MINEAANPPLHWMLIVHGSAACDESVRDAVAALRREGVELEVRVTWERGDPARMVAEACAAGMDVVIAGGGDGTLGEVAAALADRPEAADALPALAHLPLGTANDFAAAATIPSDAETALRLLRGNTPLPIDLLRIEHDSGSGWCINLASGGFGADITTETSEWLKGMLGGLAYVVTGLGRLGRIEPLPARLHGPGFDWQGEFIAMGIGNGRQAGGGQVLCPEALLDDGSFELTVIPPLEGEVGSALGAAMSGGREAALERVAIRARLPWLEIESDAELTFNLDGEPCPSHAFRIECVPARLNMHLPRDCPLLQATVHGLPTGNLEGEGASG
ncbi:lipid kinase YegS [Luteimonas sp. e5]